MAELERHTRILFRELSTKKTIFASTVRTTSPILRVTTQKPLDVVPDSL